MRRKTADGTAPAHAAGAPQVRGPMLVLFNPGARAALSGAIDSAVIAQRMRLAGLECHVIEATSEAEAERHALEAARAGTWGAVVAAGGDGTVHAVAAGLLQARVNADHADGAPESALEPPVALGILPLGTMNNMAYNLGIPNDLDAACATLARAEPRPLDLGQIDGHLFLEAAGIGLEAALFPWAESLKGRGWADPRAMLDALRVLRGFQPQPVTLDLDGRRVRLRALQVSICNVARYGLDFAAAPDARMDDGWLDVVIYERFSGWELLRDYIGIMGGRRDFRARVRRVRAQRVSVAPSEVTWDVQADGRHVSHTPVTATVLPGALRVLAPPPAAAPSRPVRGASAGPLATLVRAAAPPRASQAGETFAASTEQVRLTLAEVSDEARRAVGVESPHRSARRARMLRVAYLVGLVSGIITAIAVRRMNLLPGDLAVTLAVQRRRSPARDRFWGAVAAPGFPRLSVPLVALTAATFWALRLRLEAGFTLLASAINIANWLMKRLVRRQRPTSEMVHVARVINEPGFPSGHVMHYVSFFGFLAAAALANLRPSRLRQALVGVCAALIALVGPSRVYLGAHWPSDVGAGYLFGGLYLGGLLDLYARAKGHQAKQPTSAPERKPGRREGIPASDAPSMRAGAAD
jgi:YegS/Rv2252/BmrU family lipid kinase